MIVPVLTLLLATNPPPLAQVTCSGLEAAYLADPPCCDGAGTPKHIAQSEQGERVEAYFTHQTKSKWDADSTVPDQVYWDTSETTVRVDLPVSETQNLMDVQITWVSLGWADDPSPHFLVFANPSTEVPTHARPVNGAWDASPYMTIVRI